MGGGVVGDVAHVVVHVVLELEVSADNSSQPGLQLPLDLAGHAEATGGEGVYKADHFMPAGGDLSLPMHECWTALAGLAAAVPRIRLGALVSGNTYRHPAVLANMANTADHISGGRIVF